ncbi:hypothetical protein KCU98_g15056, partial [Aureobasidium melanogenum]
MPYHRLPTVNLFTVSDSRIQTDETDDAWVFGLPLSPNRRVSGPQDNTADDAYDEGITAEDMEGFVGQMDETLRGQGFSKSNHELDAQEEKLVDM